MENEQHIPVPPVEPIEPQAAPQIEVPEVQVPGLSFTNSAAVDPLPIPDQSADPQVSYDSQPQNEYQPPDNEYHPTTTYDYQENATPEEYQRDEQSGDAGGSFHEEASREDGEARGLKRKHEEGSFDEDDNRQKRPRIEGSGDIKQTIFIGNLPPDVTESMLTEIFSSCGKIRDIRLNRHRDTGKVKGFGFIEFEEPAYAEEALSKNGIEILGRRVNLELSNKSLINAQAAARWKDQQRQIPKERPPRNVHAAQQTRPRDSTTVFIGNLDDRVNDDDIYRMFSHCGQIKEIRWLEDKQTGRFKGCGFIDFYTTEATTAAAKMNGSMLYNRPMRVDYATGKPGADDGGRIPPLQQQTQLPPPPVNNPLNALGGLNPLVLQQLGLGANLNLANLLNVRPQAQPGLMGNVANPLASLLGNYNPNLLLQASLMGQSPNPLGLNPMMSAPNPAPTYGGRNDQPPVRRDPPKPRPYGCKTVFVGNLPDSITDDIIRSVFANVGRVVDIRWLNDKKTRRFKGCGFVEFDTEEATEQAIHLNGRMVLGQPIRVDYSTPKDGPRESKSDSGRNTGNYDSSNMMNSYSGSGGMNDSSNYYGGNVPSTNYDQSNNPAAFGLANNNATLSALLSSLTGGSGGAHPTNQ